MSEPVGSMPRDLFVDNIHITEQLPSVAKSIPSGRPPLQCPRLAAHHINLRRKRDGVLIPEARSARYTVQAQDRGHVLKVELNVMFKPLTQQTVTTAVTVPHTPRGEGFNGDRTADIFASKANGDLVLYPGTGQADGWHHAPLVGDGRLSSPREGQRTSTAMAALMSSVSTAKAL